MPDCKLHAEQIKTIGAKLKRMDEKLDRLLLLLLGNGKLGVCGKLNILWGVVIFITVTIAGLSIKAIIF